VPVEASIATNLNEITIDQQCIIPFEELNYAVREVIFAKIKYENY
jgi:hypothetical protein